MISHSEPRYAGPTAVLRVLSGEGLGPVSRDTGLPGTELKTWSRVFVEAGAKALERHVRGSQPRREMPAAEEPAASPTFALAAEADPSAPTLAVPEHLRGLWVTLGLDDE